MKSYRDIVSDGGSDFVGQVSAHASAVALRLSTIDHVVAVMSGKGGVGKSTLTANLAATLAKRGLSVGILDADINSSSIAHIMGVLGSPMTQTANGLRPAVAAMGIKVMSVDLVLARDGTPVIWDAPTQKDAFTWRSMMEMSALREFLADTDWGRLDYLLIDMPPGSDRLPNVSDLIPQLAGSIVVTIPSAVSRFVVEKSIRMATDVSGVPVIGIIENMAYCVCSNCGNEEELFPDGAVQDFARTSGVKFLGRVPFDRRVAASADRGEPFSEQRTDSPTVLAFETLADEVTAYCKNRVVTSNPG